MPIKSAEKPLMLLERLGLSLADLFSKLRAKGLKRDFIANE
jgi:hypothetical protein